MKIHLLGKHQIINACCAIAAVEVLKFHNILISDESIRRGLEKARWPGRLEIVRRSPLVILDAAHNQPAAKQLREALLEFFKKKERLILVIGILKDKEMEKILRELVPLAFKVVATAPKSSRAANPKDIHNLAIKFNPNVAIVEDVKEAVESVLTKAKEDDVICVTGSLYTVGEARQFLVEKRGGGKAMWEREKERIGGYLKNDNEDRRKG